MGSVAQPHDHAVLGARRDLEVRRNAPRVDHQRVLARRLERIRKPPEDRAAVVRDAAGLAVHQRRGADDVPAEGLPYRLVTEADAESRQPPGEDPHRFERDARLIRRLRARGDDDRPRTARRDPVHRDPVVPIHLHLGSQLKKILDQVVGERVVIIDDDDHACASARSMASISARALLTHSRYSCCGTESATIPAPAYTWATPRAITVVLMVMQETRLPE